VPAIAGAVNTCTGVLTPPRSARPRKQARLDLLKSVTQIPESFIVTDMVFVTNGLSNLIWAPDKLAGGQGVGNVGVTVQHPTIDANIQRVAYDGLARHRLEKSFTPKGDVGATKIVSLHTDGDGARDRGDEEDYADKVPAAKPHHERRRRGRRNTHCGYSAVRISAAAGNRCAMLAGDRSRLRQHSCQVPHPGRRACRSTPASDREFEHAHSAATSPAPATIRKLHRDRWLPDL
jgi:hypothetical protein